MILGIENIFVTDGWTEGRMYGLTEGQCDVNSRVAHVLDY